MAKVSLGSMLGTVEAAKAAPIETPTPAPAGPALSAVANDPAPKVAAEPKKHTVKRTRPPATKQATPPAADAGEGPRYLDLIRKEARFRDDQLDELAAITRRLNKARKGAGERLTDNSLIRVAVDMLLAKADSLAGTPADQLRESVGL
jgi:hypothetical protein